LSGFFRFSPESLLELRERKGWSREVLALRSDSSYPAILSYENGYRSPSLASLRRLAAALDVDPSDLVEESPFEVVA
jgi:transcriptional regulator with XRE-family HTH domain